MKSNRKLIVVISIVLALAVASGAIAYLVIMTDVFKSKDVLFAKYFSQNIEMIQKITDLKIVEEYEKLGNENKYESNTNIKMIHSEGGEVSNPLNNLTAKLDIQKGDNEQYLYIDGQILYDGEEYLEAEIIKKEELFGIRFTDVVKQYVTVRNDGNIESISNDIGIEPAQMEMLINILEGSEQLATNEQLNILKDKYFNILTTEISKGIFKKQKNAMITYDGVTTKTNAYSVELDSQQVHNMLIEALNNAKSEEETLDKLSLVIDKDESINQIDETISWINEELEVPSLKITVYEQKQQTIRTVIELGVYKITIENVEKNGELNTIVSYLDNNNSMQYNIEVNKKSTNTEEDFEVVVNVIEDDENYTVTLLNQMQLIDNKLELDAEISFKQDITTTSIILQNKVDIGNDFEGIQTLDSTNNIVLNDIEEEKRKAIIELLKKVVPETTNQRIDLLEQKLGLVNEENENSQIEDGEIEEQMPQVEINKFNSKFEFYTGDEVLGKNVKLLLDVAREHLASVEVAENESQQEGENIITENKKNNIKLNIEKDVLNEDGINQVFEKIDDSKKYKVSIFYKEANGLVDYITITEV